MDRYIYEEIDIQINLYTERYIYEGSIHINKYIYEGDIHIKNIYIWGSFFSSGEEDTYRQIYKQRDIYINRYKGNNIHIKKEFAIL